MFFNSEGVGKQRAKPSRHRGSREQAQPLSGPKPKGNLNFPPVSPFFSLFSCIPCGTAVGDPIPAMLLPPSAHLTPTLTSPLLVDAGNQILMFSPWLNPVALPFSAWHDLTGHSPKIRITLEFSAPPASQPQTCSLTGDNVHGTKITIQRELFQHTQHQTDPMHLLQSHLPLRKGLGFASWVFFSFPLFFLLGLNGLMSVLLT